MNFVEIFFSDHNKRSRESEASESESVRSIMATHKVSEYSIAALKEFLRDRNFTLSGSKAEFISRLTEYDSNIWTILVENERNT